ncbi:retrovirus-related Pol polyprotein from transposon 17.6 [Trichonephila clavipes]|nr:retrovirus-related Pol polyprotein from transposon 17.6 [Trichonephila clavipes]
MPQSRFSQLCDYIRLLAGFAIFVTNVPKLKTEIEESSTFESDADFVKTLIKNCIDERVSRNERQVTLENQKIELAKLQLEKEVELQTAKNKALNLNPAAKIEEKQFETDIENMVKSIKTLSLPVPTRSEHFIFQPLERAFLTKKINDEYKSEILINLLGERAHNEKETLRKETLIACGYTEDPFKNRSRNYKPNSRDSYRKNLERQNKNFYICGDSSHYARDYDIPVCQRARRLSYSENLHVNDQIDGWLQQGIIRESCSDYCSPIVLCKKKDGNLRICIDYRKMNSKTDKDRYPLPLIEEVLDQLGDLLRDNAVFHFGPEQQLAFQTLRQKLSENLVLHIFKQGAKLELHTDASKFGYEDFNYEIIHRPGKQMGHVDCLSRYPVMTITYDEITTKLANCQRNDEYINSLKHLLENKQINDFVVKNDVLYNIENDNDVLVVPQQMQTEIVKNIHSKGHLGINKTESMRNLSKQEITFGNPHRIITDKDTAFTSKEFQEYCENENIQHLSITTRIPRGNGQIEWIHSSLIPILSKLSNDDASKWYKFVPAVQRKLNSTISSSTQMTPFQLLTVAKMRTKQDLEILKLLEEEILEIFTENREKIREEAKRNILKMQEENCQNFNKKRIKAYQYEIGDIVAIQRTQFGTGSKRRPKFFGPYEVVKSLPVACFLYVSDSPRVSMKKKKNQVPLWTAYGQADRCGIGCGVVTQLNLSTKFRRQKQHRSLLRAGAADPVQYKLCFLKGRRERKRDWGCANRRSRLHIMEIYLLEI